MNNRILVADHNPEVVHLVSGHLTDADFQVQSAADGNSALGAARRDRPTLMIMDIMLPGLNGLDITRALKAEPSTASISIVLLSARAEEIDRVLGFELGVDDFVAKPFSARELVLRVKAIVGRKRPPGADAMSLEFGDILLDRDRHEVKVGGIRANLTGVEFKLLLELMKSSGRVLTRGNLLDRVWDGKAVIETRTIDTHMRRLRAKLGEVGESIHSVRGVGYRLTAR